MTGYKILTGDKSACYGFHDDYQDAKNLLRISQQHDPAATIEKYEYESLLEKVKRLAELVQADNEGRCVVLPALAKEGDPKPDCFDDYADGLWCLGYQQSETDDEPSKRCRRCWYCSAGNYAEDRAQAEAAMEGRDG